MADTLPIFGSPAADELVGASDYYDLLGVQTDADDEEIKERYREKATEVHPDQGEGTDKNRRKFQQLQQARDLLLDNKRRKLYDHVGHDTYIKLPTLDDRLDACLQEVRLAKQTADDPDIAVENMGPSGSSGDATTDPRTIDESGLQAKDVSLEHVEVNIEVQDGEFTVVETDGEEDSESDTEPTNTTTEPDYGDTSSGSRGATGTSTSGSSQGEPGDTPTATSASTGSASAARHSSEDPSEDGDPLLGLVGSGDSDRWKRIRLPGEREFSPGSTQLAWGSNSAVEPTEGMDPESTSRDRLSKEEARGKVVDLGAYNRVRWITRLGVSGVVLTLLVLMGSEGIGPLTLSAVASTTGLITILGVCLVFAVLSTTRVVLQNSRGLFEQEERIDYKNPIKRGVALAAVAIGLGVTASDPVQAWQSLFTVIGGQGEEIAVSGLWLTSSMGPESLVLGGNFALACLFVIATVVAPVELSRGVSMWSWYSYFADGNGFSWEVIIWDVVCILPVVAVTWSVLETAIRGQPTTLSVDSVGAVPVGLVIVIATVGLLPVYGVWQAITYLGVNAEVCR